MPENSDDQPIETTPDAYDLAAPDGAPEEQATRRCESCGKEVGLEVIVCPVCGFHRDLKRTTRAAPGSESEPEVPLAPSKRDQWRQEASREVTRRAYLIPLLMFVVGAGLVATVRLMTGGPAAAGGYLLSYATHLPLGLAAFWICSMLWIGFDSPVILTAVQLAGIYAAADAALLLPSWIGWVASLAVYIGLLSEMLDLDYTDAIAVAVVTLVMKVGIMVAISI